MKPGREAGAEENDNIPSITCCSLYIMKFNPFCIKSNEREDPFHIAVVFFEFQNRVRHSSVHHSEITFSVSHIEMTCVPDQVIERAG